MKFQQGQTKPLLTSIQRASYKLEQARTLSSRATELLALVKESHWSNGQRIRRVETRIDQILTKTTPVSYQSMVALFAQNKSDSLVNNSPSSGLVQQLQQQIQQRSELLRHSVHDLRGNFSIISFATSELTQAQTNEEREKFLDMLQRNTQQANQLMTELLDITRLEAGQEYLQLTTFDVAQMLNKLTKTVQPLADKQGLQLQTQGNKSLLIEGDSTKLYRITQNLLLNAINHTQVGSITLSWKKSQSISDRWQLAITDTGPGLSRTHSSSGEGVGLTIVRGLCQLLEGEISVETPRGGGTRFKLSFPKQYLNQ